MERKTEAVREDETGDCEDHELPCVIPEIGLNNDYMVVQNKPTAVFFCSTALNRVKIMLEIFLISVRRHCSMQNSSQETKAQ